MRIGFTIIFNGLHHLLHNNYAEELVNMLDYWVVVEGAAGNIGSTRWCKSMPEKYHKNGSSVDGTVEYFSKMKEHNLVILASGGKGMWDSKDTMVNAAIDHINQHITKEAFLWQIDCDELWSPEAMDEAEKQLDGDTGMFLADYYVGKNLMAKDRRPYKRLWRWKGQAFTSHEPPLLEGGNGKEVLLPQRFNHYAYYYEKDVQFKNDWYGGHAGIYKRWLELQKETEFPQPLSRLLPHKTGEICRI